MLDERRLSLADVRDLLLPVLHMEAGQNKSLQFAIVIDYRHEALVVKGYNTENKNVLGFAITKEHIDDNTYKESFRPNLLKLIKCLYMDPVKVKEFAT